MLLSRHHDDFEASGCRSSDPTAGTTPTKPSRAKCVYNLHRKVDDVRVSAGASVYDTSGLCLLFFSSDLNAFGSTFEIEYEYENDAFVCPFLAHEMTSCFQLDNDLTHSLAHPGNFPLLDCGIPTNTLRVLLDAILKRLENVRTENFEIFNPSHCTSPAAFAHVSAFTSGAIGSRIPDNSIW